MSRISRIAAVLLLAAALLVVDGWIVFAAMASLMVVALAMLGLAGRPDRQPPGTPPWRYRPAAAARAIVLDRVYAFGVLPELPRPANDVGGPGRLAA